MQCQLSHDLIIKVKYSPGKVFSSLEVRLIEKTFSLVMTWTRLSRIMTTSDGSQTLLLEQLHPSICLLELLTGRPANLDELIIDSKKSSLVSDISDTADSGECDLEEDLKDVEIISAEDAKQHHPKILRNKVLDRLAETLARYKSDPNVNSGPILDPKHVSSTMMIIDEKHNKVEILCAKNEGLDQHDSTDDTDFLNSWKTSMERIARKGDFIHCRHTKK